MESVEESIPENKVTLSVTPVVSYSEPEKEKVPLAVLPEIGEGPIEEVIDITPPLHEKKEEKKTAPVEEKKTVEKEIPKKIEPIIEKKIEPKKELKSIILTHEYILEGITLTKGKKITILEE
jgi:hypothetical protein